MAGLLENKVVIVAGLGGIGNGVARRYADEGALLVIGDLDAELAARVAAELDPSGDRVRAVPLDGADEDSVISIVKLAVDTFGRLDGMHVNFANAADAYLPGGVVELPLEAFDEVMRPFSARWPAGRESVRYPAVIPPLQAIVGQHALVDHRCAVVSPDLVGLMENTGRRVRRSRGCYEHLLQQRVDEHRLMFSVAQKPAGARRGHRIQFVDDNRGALIGWPLPHAVE